MCFCINTGAHTDISHANPTAEAYSILLLFYIYNFHLHSEKPSSKYPQYLYIIAQSLNTQRLDSELLIMSPWKINLLTVEFSIFRVLLS